MAIAVSRTLFMYERTPNYTQPLLTSYVVQSVTESLVYYVFHFTRYQAIPGDCMSNMFCT